MKQYNNRINFLDISKGIGIILMIIGHTIPKNNLLAIIYSFHMPLFIIISGYLYKEKSTTALLKNLTKKIFIPYVFCILFVTSIQSIVHKEFNFLNLLLYIFLGNTNRKIFDIASVGVLWYLPFFIVVNVLFNSIKLYSKKNEFKLYILSIILTLSGLYLGYKGVYLPWCIDVALASMVLYYTGYILKKYNILSYVLKRKIIILIIVLLYFLTLSFGNIELASRSYPYGLISFICSILGSVIIYCISYNIEKRWKHISTLLSWYGKNSIYILLFHHIEMRLLNYNVFNQNIIVIIIIKLIIVTILTNYYMFLKNAFNSLFYSIKNIYNIKKYQEPKMDSTNIPIL